jgi:site-specific recombinase XerD
VPSFPTLLQRFLVEHLGQHRAVSPRTIAAYRDTFRLLLQFAEETIGKSPTTLSLADLNMKLILSFLDYLEKKRNNSARSRNARLAALRSFLKYAAHHDLTALSTIEQTLAVPMKRFEKPMLGFLTRPEMQAILDAPDPQTWTGQRDRAFFNVLYNTGARVSEVIGLRIRDVVVDGATAAVHLQGKGRKERSVPLWKIKRHSAPGFVGRQSGRTAAPNGEPLDITAHDPSYHGDASSSVWCRYHRDCPLARP